jgi:hypothetical protein
MNDETWCYVDNGEGVEKRPVELGRNNDKFVQIVEGLQIDDRAVLNPMAIANMEKSDAKTISPEVTDASKDIVFANDFTAEDLEPAKVQAPAVAQKKRNRGRRSGSRTRDESIGAKKPVGVPSS